MSGRWNSGSDSLFFTINKTTKKVANEREIGKSEAAEGMKGWSDNPPF